MAAANFNPKASTKVDFHNADRGPMLFVAASEDHTVPASVTREAYKHYTKSPVLTDFHQSEGRDHFTAGAPGWRPSPTTWRGGSTRSPHPLDQRVRRRRP